MGFTSTLILTPAAANVCLCSPVSMDISGSLPSFSTVWHQLSCTVRDDLEDPETSEVEEDLCGGGSCTGWALLEWEPELKERYRAV